MKAYLATVLSGIAVGVLLIAYGLLAPRADAIAPVPTPDRSGAAAPVVFDPQTGVYQLARPIYAGEQVALSPRYAPSPVAASYVTMRGGAAEHRAPSVSVERRRSRDWTKTALVIGGSAASGAGLGAVVGGKKGALIGAAIGGGASTLWEALRR